MKATRAVVVAGRNVLSVDAVAAVADVRVRCRREDMKLVDQCGCSVGKKVGWAG